MKKLVIAVSLPALVAASVALAASATISTGHTKVGRVLVSSNGHTLYLLQGDSGKPFLCTGKCLGFWPPLMKTGNVTVSGGAKAALVGSVKRAAGRQVTYKGHPLYWFAGDKKAGQDNGEGIVLGGHTWYAVSASGGAGDGLNDYDYDYDHDHDHVEFVELRVLKRAVSPQRHRATFLQAGPPSSRRAGPVVAIVCSGSTLAEYRTDRDCSGAMYRSV